MGDVSCKHGQGTSAEVSTPMFPFCCMNWRHFKAHLRIYSQSDERLLAEMKRNHGNEMRAKQAHEASVRVDGAVDGDYVCQKCSKRFPTPSILFQHQGTQH